MPQPTSSDVHVDRPLTNISIAYMQDPARSFVADKVFPIVPVQKQSDKYFVYRRSDWHRTQAENRADATESAGSGYNLTTDGYSAVVRAVHKDVGDQVRANSDEPINMDRDATQWVTQQLLLDRERRFVESHMQSGIWADDVTPATGWSDPDSDPIGDIADQGLVIAGATGIRPNKLVIGADVWKALKNHPDILDRIKYTQRGIVTVDLLAALFDVDEVLVTWAVLNDTDEDPAGGSEDSAFMVTESALLCYANPSPSILQPSAGYTFGWTGLLGTAAAGAPRISRIPVPLKKADRIEGEMAYDQKVVAPELGIFFESALSGAP